MIANEIVQLLQTNGMAPCDSAPVSQAAHAVQCAMLAMEALGDLPVIIGALLHDIGCLLKPEHTTGSRIYDGTADEAATGAAYLYRKGFSERVCAMAAQHTSGKRYLLATDKNYWSKLSPVNLQALHRQGGPMTAEDAATFERQPYFMDIVRVCRWDADARKSQAPLLPLSFFHKLLWDHLSRNPM
jgi:predicted HD phosphohydrolase